MPDNNISHDYPSVECGFIESYFNSILDARREAEAQERRSRVEIEPIRHESIIDALRSNTPGQYFQYSDLMYPELSNRMRRLRPGPASRNIHQEYKKPAKIGKRDRLY